MMDHDYNFSMPREACGDNNIEDLEVDNTTSKHDIITWAPTLTKGQNPKKIRRSQVRTLEDEDTAAAILQAVNVLTQKMDKQTVLLWLTGLPEKDDGNTRETVTGILTRVVPVSVD